MGIVDKISENLPSAAKLRTLLATALILTVPFILYYLFYIKSQTKYFTDRDFRALARVGSQITTRVDSLSGVLKNAGEKFVLPDKCVEDANKSAVPSPSPFKPGAGHNEENLRELKKIFGNLKDFGPDIIAVEARSEKENKFAEGQTLASAVTAEVRQEEGSNWLYFKLKYTAADDSNTATLTAKTDFDKLIDPIAGGGDAADVRDEDREEGFDGLLIAKAGGGGRVIYQQGDARVRLVSLDKLSADDDGGKPIDLVSLEQSSNVADVKFAGSSYKLFMHPVDLSISTEGKDSLRWVLCGLVPASRFRRDVWSISYSVLIFVAFVTALCVLSWPFVKLILIGPKDRLRTADVYFFFFATLIALALITSMGLYGYSYLSFDGYTSLGIKGKLDTQLEELAANVKKNFTEEVATALSQLDALNRDPNLETDLRAADSRCGGSGKLYRLGLLKKRTPDDSLPYPYFDTAVWIDKDGEQKLKWTVRDYAPQFVNVSDRLYVTNLRDGLYRRLGSRELPPPPSVEWSWPPWLYNFAEHEFWLEQITSKTTGRNEVEISASKPDARDGDKGVSASARPTPTPKPAQTSREAHAGAGGQGQVSPAVAARGSNASQSTATEKPPAPRWISAFDARLLSLMQPVLPAGFGFCVIDEGGRVLFHSDEAHHLGENFFEESDDDHALRSAVVDRRAALLDVRYLGRGHRLYTTPLENFPGWTLVTFRDKQVLRTAYLEILTLCALFFFFYYLVILISVSIFYLVNLNTGERRAWLWPSPSKVFIYYASALALLALSLASVAIYSRSGPWSVVFVSLAGFLAIGLFVLNLKCGERLRGPLRRLARKWFRRLRKTPGLYGKIRAAHRRIQKRYEVGYFLNLFLLFLLVAVIPAAAFFKFAYESEIALFIKHGQITLARGLAEREARILSQYAGRSEKDEEAFINDRLNKDWDVYNQFFFRSTLCGPDSPSAAVTSRCAQAAARDAKPVEQFNPVRYFLDFMPLYNRTSIERLGLIDGAFADHSYEWTGTTDPLELRLGDTAASRSPWRRVVTNVPPFGRPGLFWWAVFLLAGIPFYLWWVRPAVRKIFLLGLHKPASYPLSALPCQALGDGNLFVILESPYTQSHSHGGGRFHLVCLRNVSGPPDWAEKYNYAELPRGGKIIVDHFEHRSDDPAANRQKLHFLGQLQQRKHTALVISAIEPAGYRFAGDEAGGGNGANGPRACEDFDRWSGLISSFFTVYAEDRGDPVAFRAEVEEERASLLGQAQRLRKPRSEKEVDELLATLKEECSPKAPLQKLGLRILKQQKFVELTREHLIARVRNQAATYYQDVWDSCTPGEKLTVSHLAHDRLLSPNDPDVAPLLRRGLIVRDPDVHLMNESFRQFVKSERCARDVAACEEEAKKGSLWHIMKAPLLVVLMSVVAFLFITQRDIYTSTLAVMTAITTAIPAFFQVLRLFQKEPVTPPDPH